MSAVIDFVAWRQNHDDPSSRIVPSLLRHVYPYTRQDIIDIVRQTSMFGNLLMFGERQFKTTLSTGFLPRWLSRSSFSAAHRSTQILKLHLGVFARQDHAVGATMEGCEHSSFSAARCALSISTRGWNIDIDARPQFCFGVL